MSKVDRTIRIGTRGSPLAMAQTHTVCGLLARTHPELKTEIVVIKTSGDWVPSDGEVRLSEAEGGKGQFAKEIEQALLAGEIDAAVHSMKDMDSNLPEGLVIDHMLEREDPCDALLFSDGVKNLAGNSQNQNGVISMLPQGAVVGTASVRRAAFLLSRRPDLKIVPFRGNVGTRIEKVRGGQVACTCLAMAGLNRLNLSDEADLVLSPEEMLPAAGQGAVGIETCYDNDDVSAIFSHINNERTMLCVKTEREALRVLDGSCHTPIGAYAVFKNDELWLRVCVVSLDGTQRFEDEIRGIVKTPEEATALGSEIGQRLKQQIPTGILSDE